MRQGASQSRGLDQLYDSLISRLGKKKLSSWQTSYRFKELKTAKAWGLTPNQWDDLEPDDKAQMIAFLDVEAKMSLVDAEQRL